MRQLETIEEYEKRISLKRKMKIFKYCESGNEMVFSFVGKTIYFIAQLFILLLFCMFLGF